MSDRVSDVAFSDAVKAVQARLGSREMLAARDWSDRLSEDLVAFLAGRDSFYLATASADGQPYLQHRGGPKGFLKVIDDRTLAFADFAGNRQYITVGNLSENDRAAMFVMDYAGRQRVKLWGRARVVDDDAGLIERLHDPAYRARVQRAIVFEVRAWDANCSQHITPRHDESTVARAMHKVMQENAELKAEIERLRGGAGRA